jgi:hypothetical protein
VHEVTEWLKTKNTDLSNRLTKLMSIAGMHQEFHPVTEFKTQEPEEGVCEYCGLFSNDLGLKDGKWVCKECDEFES